MALQVFDARPPREVYATSRDFHLRELEIAFIREQVPVGASVVDIGCGNGYTLLCLARDQQGTYMGLDFSPRLIEGARALAASWEVAPGARTTFVEGDARSLPLQDDSYDVALSERCLLNLPSRQDQFTAIREIHRVLRPGGRYIMVEGTEDGLRRLNHLRELVGLATIPSVSNDNATSLKFDETELEAFLSPLFHVRQRRYFGTYYLVSRVLHPMLVHPADPQFDSPINEAARRIAEILPDTGRLGHVMGYVLEARK